MTSSVRLARAVRDCCSTRRIALAVLASLVPAALVAQGAPYEAGQRSSYGSGLGQTGLPSGGTIAPRVDTTLQYAANINLAPDGEPQIDMAGLELAPGFYASYSSGRAVGAIDYALIGRVWEDSDFNDVSHRLLANGSWIILPEWFAVRGSARYTDGLIDPGVSLNYGGIGVFAPSNLEEVGSFSINPTLQHSFNDFTFVADYRYGRTMYFDFGKGQPAETELQRPDSRDHNANVSLGTNPDGRRMSGTIFYNWQKSEFDNSLLPYEFERAGIDLGMTLARSISLLGSYGRETDLRKPVAAGGLDEQFWNAGLRWSPNERTSVEARYGDYSFGESYSLSAEHRARLLAFTASYSEQPTVVTQRLSLGDFVPGELPPDVPDVDLGTFNSLPYLLRQAGMGVTALGSRTNLGLNGFWYERDYLASQNDSDESGYGATFDAGRQLGSNLSADFRLSYRQFERGSSVVLDPVDAVRDTEARLQLSRASSEKLTLTAEAGYLMRTGGQEYDGWWTALRARWTP